MTGPHDIIHATDLSHGGCQLECACGKTLTGTSKDDARRKHAHHFGVENARAALEEGRQP